MNKGSPERILNVVGAAILTKSSPSDPSRVLIVQRPKGNGRSSDKWEFPGGKIEKGESPAQALAREIEEELALDVTVGRSLGNYVHEDQGVRVILEVFICEIRAGVLQLREHQAFRWVNVDEILQFDLLAADKPFVQRLKDHFQRGI